MGRYMEIHDVLRSLHYQYTLELQRYLPASPHISPYLPRAPLCRGRLRLISGGTAEGLHLLRKSQQLAAKMGMPYDEALALRLLSMHSKSSARESQQAAQEAQEIFKRLGVDPSLV